ncbi:MAG TPA: hypothetical protein VFE16_07270 [Candidatus Cybelea sp.]|jgi:TolB-like protein|nr:hypothetical protein [Candidatus Cybelea sp.]
MCPDVTYGKTEPFDGARPEEIRAQVERITSNELFASAERLCRFLRFTVDAVLDGRAEQIKEYVIGREVFDRGEGYDPRVDPIVRVEARRLRSRLTEYYAGPGREEPFRLEYPKGGYLPVVRPVDSTRRTEPARPPAARVAWITGLTALALVVAAVVSAFNAGRSASPAVIVAPIPISWIEPNDGTLDGVDVALAEDVTADLANQPGTNVVAWPEIVRKKSLRLLALGDFASQLDANRLLVVVVRKTGSSRVARVFVIDEPSGRKRLALTYARPPVATFEQQDALAARIARDLNRDGATK